MDIQVKAVDEQPAELATPFAGDTDTRRRGPRPLRLPRFRVATWMWTTVICALWLAAARWLPPSLVVASLLLGVIVLAHIAANAIGTTLRGGSVQRPAVTRIAGPTRSVPVEATTASRLSHRGGCGRFTAVCSTLGGVAGGVGGGGWLARANWEHLSVGSLLLAVGSCGILGALLGFWIGSFSQVVLQTWADAHRRHS